MPIDIQIELFDHLHESANIASRDRKLAQSKPRIIASTSKNKEDLIGKNHFIEDLFYELSFFQIFLPPLRERTNDIPTLAEHFVHLFSSQGKRDFNYKMSKEFLAHLEAYNWPGNLNELINIINLAISNAAGGDLLTPVHLSDKIVSLNLKTGSRRLQPVTGKGMSVFSTAGKDHFQQLADKRASDILKTSDNKKGEAVTLKREDLSRILSNTGEDKSIESYPQKPTEDSTENSKNRATIKFYQSGDFWIIGEKGHETQFKEVKGFKFISFLLQYPNKQLTALSVYNAGKKLAQFVADGMAFEEDLNIDDDILKSIKEDGKISATKVLNEIERLKKRLASNDFDNPEEAMTIKQDIGYLEKMIIYNSRKKGLKVSLKKTARDHKSQGEKARVNVTKRIHSALEKIHEKLPNLGLYLNTSTIRTGDTFCYAPVIGKEPIWILKKSPTLK